MAQARLWGRPYLTNQRTRHENAVCWERKYKKEQRYEKRVHIVEESGSVCYVCGRAQEPHLRGSKKASGCRKRALLRLIPLGLERGGEEGGRLARLHF
jgi:hypothetical protein